VTRRAFEQNKCGLSLWNPRDFTTDNHRTVDDRPYGGGPGMVMLAKPLELTITAAKQRQTDAGLPAPRGVHVAPGQAVDARARDAAEAGARSGDPVRPLRSGGPALLDRVVDEEISLGDFVLSGGELPAMA
jgi:tRNA (guanine37-N1)-methyltransferase